MAIRRKHTEEVEGQRNTLSAARTSNDGSGDSADGVASQESKDTGTTTMLTSIIIRVTTTLRWPIGRLVVAPEHLAGARVRWAARRTWDTIRGERPAFLILDIAHPTQPGEIQITVSPDDILLEGQHWISDGEDHEL